MLVAVQADISHNPYLFSSTYFAMLIRATRTDSILHLASKQGKQLLSGSLLPPSDLRCPPSQQAPRTAHNVVCASSSFLFLDLSLEAEFFNFPILSHLMFCRKQSRRIHRSVQPKSADRRSSYFAFPQPALPKSPFLCRTNSIAPPPPTTP